MSDQPAGTATWTAGQLTWWLLALLLGLGLRLGHAEALAQTVFEWESDGFVMGLEGRSWDAINRVRAPGLGLTLDRLGSALHVSDVREVRWLCVGLSLLALLAALDLAVAVSRVTGMRRRSLGRAVAWGTTVWAVQPTLVRSAVSPTPELLLGAGLCLLVAGMARWRAGSPCLGWIGFSVGAALAVIVGGSVVALALCVGLLVYLLPVPRLPMAVAALLAVGMALGSGYLAQRGPAGADREWLPDTAPAYSLLALVEAPPPYPATVPFQPETRESGTLERAAAALSSAPAADVALALARRLGPELLGPRRLAPLLTGLVDAPLEPAGLPARRALGAFDVLLRGGLLLFCLAVLGLTWRPELSSSWPRAGLVLGLLVCWTLVAATAVGPLGQGPFDLLLLGGAAAGVAGADPTRPWTRRLAFVVGGALLCTLLITAGVDDRPGDPWLAEMGHRQHQGEQLALLLEDGGPASLIGQLHACYLLSLPEAPFLRRPRLAMSYALSATMLDPESDDATVALITAQAESGLYREAAMLAEGAHRACPPGSESSRRMELMLDWVVKEQRDAALR